MHSAEEHCRRDKIKKHWCFGGWEEEEEEEASKREGVNLSEQEKSLMTT